jgi:hypothetical protein
LRARCVTIDLAVQLFTGFMTSGGTCRGGGLRDSADAVAGGAGRGVGGGGEAVTPAIEPGVSDHVWSVEEIARLAD